MHATKKRQRQDATVVPRARVWLELTGEGVLGGGRVALLEAIAAHGSISEAARGLGVSYRAAWRWIDRLNEAAGAALVQTATGGREGGGARLTPLGEAALAAYHLAEKEVQAALTRAAPKIARRMRQVRERVRGRDRSR